MSNKLIIIEDDPSVIHLLKRYMKRIDWQPELIHFEYGTDAIEHFNHNRSDDAVLLLDLNLPDMSGVDILEQVRQQDAHTNLPVIVTTTSNLNEDRLECLALGVNDFIEKPVRFDDLINRLAHLDIVPT